MHGFRVGRSTLICSAVSSEDLGSELGVPSIFLNVGVGCATEICDHYFAASLGACQGILFRMKSESQCLGLQERPLLSPPRLLLHEARVEICLCTWLPLVGFRV